MFNKFLMSLGVLPMTLLALTLFFLAFAFFAGRALRGKREEQDAVAALPLQEDDHVC
ncbi:MAG: hypothetical protein MUF64_21315 [Polyangiaceae bacterium]|jgi:cbb3-type cytochrome oxidase subunit 3|nr:hypothetical protein [Polyangiaceae bacterium]